MDNKEILTTEYPDDSWLLADGFNDAIIGVHRSKVVYSTKKCVEILMERDNMTYEDALEFFFFNVDGAYVGEKTPIFVDDMLFTPIYHQLNTE